MAIQISQVNGAGSAIIIYDTVNFKELYFQPDSIVEVGPLNGIPAGSVLIRDSHKCIFIKAEDVTVPSTYSSASDLAWDLAATFLKGGGGSGGGGDATAANQVIGNDYLQYSYNSLVNSEYYLQLLANLTSVDFGRLLDDSNTYALNSYNILDSIYALLTLLYQESQIFQKATSSNYASVSGAASGILLGADPLTKKSIIYNNTGQNVNLNIGSAASSTDFIHILPTGQTYIIDGVESTMVVYYWMASATGDIKLIYFG